MGKEERVKFLCISKDRRRIEVREERIWSTRIRPDLFQYIIVHSCLNKGLLLLRTPPYMQEQEVLTNVRLNQLY
jgi:hypothetical protein